MFELRPYQKKAVEECVSFIKKKTKKKGVAVLPTGAGKSLVISNIALALNEPTLVLQPSKEILLQNYDKAVSYGMSPTIYSASCDEKELSRLTYATLKSIKNEVERIKEIGIKVVLIDECHFGYSPDEGSEFMTFMNKLEDVRVLGFTATPCRLKSYATIVEGNYSMLNIISGSGGKYFDEIIHITQIKELVNEGFWSKIHYEVWDLDDSILKLNSTGAEFSENSIKDYIAKSGINNAIYRRITQLMKERNHILVCMDSVESCERLSSYMNERMGYITDVVTSKTKKKDRSRIIEEFKSGKLKIVFNFSTLSTGFDFPDLDCVVMGRPTFSFSIYYQTIGRGVRLGNKVDCLIVDACNNYKRFGSIELMSIEKYHRRGWCMFSGEQLISGIRIGNIVTKQHLEERRLQLERERETGGKADYKLDKYGRRESPLDEHIMWFGKYEGCMFKNIPLWYFKYLVDNKRSTDTSAGMKRVEEYYKHISF